MGASECLDINQGWIYLKNPIRSREELVTTQIRLNLSIASICPWKSTYARWLNAEISGHSSAARGSRRPNNIHNTTGHIHCLWHFLAIRTEIHWAWRANNNHFDGKSCFRSATVLHFAPFRSGRQAGVVLPNAQQQQQENPTKMKKGGRHLGEHVVVPSQSLWPSP